MATKPQVTYHSALHPPFDAPSADRFVRDGSVAFVYDLAAHGGVLPAEYGACDVLYTEMAWRPGYRIFQERAACSRPTSFAEYLEALSGMVSRVAVPACIITAPSLVRYMPAVAFVPLTILLFSSSRLVPRAIPRVLHCSRGTCPTLSSS